MSERSDVVEGKDDTQPTAAPQEVRAEVVQDIVHHRIGGRAGVRVEHRSVGGETRMKRVTGGNDETALGPMIQVPGNVLAQVSVMLTDHDKHAPEPALRARLIELLGPWLPR